MQKRHSFWYYKTHFVCSKIVLPFYGWFGYKLTDFHKKIEELVYNNGGRHFINSFSMNPITVQPHYVEVQPYKIVDESFTWNRLLMVLSTGKVSRKLVRVVGFLAVFFWLRLTTAWPEEEPHAFEVTQSFDFEDDIDLLESDSFVSDSEINSHLLQTSSLPNVYLQGNSFELGLIICFFTSSFWLTIHVLCKPNKSLNTAGSPSDKKATYTNSAHASVSASTRSTPNA
jgi:hypothetical protein